MRNSTGPQSQVAIRRARWPDVSAVVGVHERARAAYYGDRYQPYGPGVGDWWRQRIADTDSEAWVGELVGRICGASSYGWMEVDGVREFELMTLHVDPAAWSLGIGGGLHDAYVSALARSGAASGRLEVWDGNARATGFYTRRGWQPDGTSRPADGGTSFVRMRLAARSAAARRA